MLMHGERLRQDNEFTKNQLLALSDFLRMRRSTALHIYIYMAMPYAHTHFAVGEKVEALMHEHTIFLSPRSADLHADLNLNVSVKAVFVLNARTTIYPAASNTRILFFIYIFSHTHIVFAASVCGHKAFQNGLLLWEI